MIGVSLLLTSEERTVLTETVAPPVVKAASGTRKLSFQRTAPVAESMAYKLSLSVAT